jgi:hypothetical protein
MVTGITTGEGMTEGGMTGEGMKDTEATEIATNERRKRGLASQSSYIRQLKVSSVHS